DVRLVVRQRAGHRRAPQQLIAELAAGKAVDRFQFLQGVGGIVGGAGDEFQQGFGVIGGELRVGQRRAQGRRVRGVCQVPAGVDAQAFPLDTVQGLGEQWKVVGLAEQGQAAVEKIAQVQDSYARESPQYGVGQRGLQGGCGLQTNRRARWSAWFSINNSLP